MSQFRHTSAAASAHHEMTVTALEPNPYLILALYISSATANMAATHQIPRERVKALHKWLGEWLERCPEDADGQ